MLTLYYGSGSPYAWRVNLALEHKALPYGAAAPPAPSNPQQPAAATWPAT